MSKLIICTFLIGLLLASCGSIPPTYYYRLDYDISTNQSNHPAAVAIHLGIETLKADLLYESEKIVYRDSPYEANFYHYRRWIAPPRKMIGEKLIKDYQQAHRFATVVKLPSSRSVDYVLGGRLLSFEELDEGEKWFGAVAIDFTLRKADSQEIIWSETFIEKTATSSREPAQVVVAINQSLNKVIQQSIEASAAFLAAQ